MISLRNPIAQLSVKDSCPECGETRLLRDDLSGELVCQSCGMVISTIHLDTSPEWRAFDSVQREKLTRVGAPTTWTIHDKGLSTTIGWQDRDAFGKQLRPEMRTRLYRLRKWQRRSKFSESQNRNLSKALSEINNIQFKLNLPRNVIETSSMIYRKALKASLVRGRTITSVVIACVYMACRQCNILRTLEELAVSVYLSKKDVARNYRFLLRELRSSVPQVDPENYIGKIVSKLKLSGETERLAKRVLHQASLMKLTNGRGPAGMAASCVYLSSRITGDLRTQEDIAREAQVTEVTIRNRYKELFTCLDIKVHL